MAFEVMNRMTKLCEIWQPIKMLMIFSMFQYYWLDVGIENMILW